MVVGRGLKMKYKCVQVVIILVFCSAVLGECEREEMCIYASHFDFN